MGGVLDLRGQLWFTPDGGNYILLTFNSCIDKIQCQNIIWSLITIYQMQTITQIKIVNIHWQNYPSNFDTLHLNLEIGIEPVNQ